MLNLQITLQNLLITLRSLYYILLIPCLPSQARCEIGSAIYLFV